MLRRRRLVSALTLRWWCWGGALHVIFWMLLSATMFLSSAMFLSPCFIAKCTVYSAISGHNTKHLVLLWYYEKRVVLAFMPQSFVYVWLSFDVRNHLAQVRGFLPAPFTGIAINSFNDSIICFPIWPITPEELFSVFLFLLVPPICLVPPSCHVGEQKSRHKMVEGEALGPKMLRS